MCNISGKKILIISPHTDDAEIGAGATLCKLSDNNDLYHASFSFAQESLLPGFALDSAQVEFFKSAELIGIPVSNRISFDYKVRNFGSERQSILEDLIKLKSSVNPDIIITTSSFDTHQDHKVIHEESFRAFKDRTILGYEMPANNKSFSPHLFSIISHADMCRKKDLIAIYKSQLVKTPNLLEIAETTAAYRGAQVRQRYAESFEVIRLLL